jgi:hypothetical protein
MPRAYVKVRRWLRSWMKVILSRLAATPQQPGKPLVTLKASDTGMVTMAAVRRVPPMTGLEANMGEEMGRSKSSMPMLNSTSVPGHLNCRKA